MAKIPLARAVQVKVPLGDVLKMKGTGFEWTKPSPNTEREQND